MLTMAKPKCSAWILRYCDADDASGGDYGLADLAFYNANVEPMSEFLNGATSLENRRAEWQRSQRHIPAKGFALLNHLALTRYIPCPAGKALRAALDRSAPCWQN